MVGSANAKIGFSGKSVADGRAMRRHDGTELRGQGHSRLRRAADNAGTEAEPRRVRLSGVEFLFAVRDLRRRGRFPCRSLAEQTCDDIYGDRLGGLPVAGRHSDRVHDAVGDPHFARGNTRARDGRHPPLSVQVVSAGEPRLSGGRGSHRNYRRDLSVGAGADLDHPHLRLAHGVSGARHHRGRHHPAMDVASPRKDRSPTISSTPSRARPKSRCRLIGG